MSLLYQSDSQHLVTSDWADDGGNDGWSGEWFDYTYLFDNGARWTEWTETLWTEAFGTEALRELISTSLPKALLTKCFLLFVMLLRYHGQYQYVVISDRADDDSKGDGVEGSIIRTHLIEEHRWADLTRSLWEPMFDHTSLESI